MHTRFLVKAITGIRNLITESTLGMFLDPIRSGWLVPALVQPLASGPRAMKSGRIVEVRFLVYPKVAPVRIVKAIRGNGGIFLHFFGNR